MKTGIELITEEREKQITKYGFTGEHHFNHPEWYDNNQLTEAANTLSMVKINQCAVPVNWDMEWFTKLIKKPYKERLAIAGALIAAEIDRLNFKS